MFEGKLIGSGSQILLAAGLTTFLLALLLVATSKSHGRFTNDLPGAVQKFHQDPTPRVGGLAIYFGLAMAWFLDPATGLDRILVTLLLAGLPALSLGLIEDLTKGVGVAPRLLATLASGALAWLVSDMSLARLDVPFLDPLLAYAPIAVLFTAFAVGGVANAINIIDGFNGLASGTVIIASLALAAIAYLAGDKSLALACIGLAVATGGFWLVNFPTGKLFLGDGGAYFLGFSLGWLALLLPMRNADVSPWASFLICAYPITEVLYSIVRRRRLHLSPGEADRSHLHSLVATEFVQPRLAGMSAPYRHAAVSAMMWAHVATSALLAIALYRNTAALVLCVIAYAFGYHVWYRRLADSEAAATTPSEWTK